VKPVARALAVFLAVSSAPAAAADALLLAGGTVYTDVGRPPVQAAVLVEGGTIAFVGPEAEARARAPKARVANVSGGAVYPGFTDAHGHLLGLAQFEENLELRGKQKTEILEMVKARAAVTKPGQWIRGRAWDQNLWPGQAFPTAAELSKAAPDHPVVLRRIDGHAIWVNTLSIERAGAAGKPDPPGGRVIRDAQGNAAGVFVDNAKALIERAIAEPGPEEVKRLFARALEACARVGLTGVGDGSGYGRMEIEALRTLSREGKMPIRVYATVGPGPDLKSFLDAPPIQEGPLTVHAVKLYADGALGSRGAALLAPYADEPGNSGLMLTPPATLDETVALSMRKGWQVWIHAIGDRGNRAALEAFEKGLAATGAKDARPRDEHAQVVALPDFARFARSGVIASIQPTHATSDMPWAEARVGAARIAGAYAWRTLLKAGARLAGGSDFPVESEDPLLGFYAAVTRQDLTGYPSGGWRASEALTRAEALRLFTADNAYAEFAEARRGRIAPGFDADITVLDRDIASEAVPVSEIPKARVVLTIVNGRVVHGAVR
jgi:predicted amidohydrolase YtcJ